MSFPDRLLDSTRGENRPADTPLAPDASDRASLAVLLPEGSLAARLIVSESSGRWAVALRRCGFDRREMTETRSLAACWDGLAEAPASFLVVEPNPAQIDDLLRRLARLGREYPLAHIAVVGATELPVRLQWLLRESGVVHLFATTRSAATLAALARTHLAQAPEPPKTHADHVWSSLPWPRRATAAVWS